jgi:protein involved in polysaccharide export with SLBB domain
MHYRNYLLVAMLAAAACSGSPPVLPVAQPGNTVRTRAELQQQLRDHESTLASGQLSDDERQRVTMDVESIRSRLEYGDFRVGDRILFSVQGEENLPDTLTVAPGQVVEMPLLGEISVAGVLRSEIRSHLTDEVSRFIRDPVVRANGLMRVSILGAVGNPGFYSMPAETVLGEAIMVAGGPAGNANLEAVQIRRGATVLMEDDLVFESFRQGLTLDQLNLQAGDQITVPDRRGTLATLSIVTGVVGSLSFLFWIFR